MALNPQPSTCLNSPHPSLALYSGQLDHWFKTQIPLLQQAHDLLRSLFPFAPPQAEAPNPSHPPQPPAAALPKPLSAPLSSCPSIPSCPALTLHALQTAAALIFHNSYLTIHNSFLKLAKLLLTCQKLQNKAAHAEKPQATDFQDDEQAHSQAIALMRKTFFANVNEYERSGRLKIPPAADPGPKYGAGTLPVANSSIPTVPSPSPAGNPENVKG